MGKKYWVVETRMGPKTPWRFAYGGRTRQGAIKHFDFFIHRKNPVYTKMRIKGLARCIPVYTERPD